MVGTTISFDISMGEQKEEIIFFNFSKFGSSHFSNLSITISSG
jgi:hypothetical protein